METTANNTVTPNTSVYMVQTQSTQNKASIISNSDESVIFKACLQQGDFLNLNNKIYPSTEIRMATIDDERFSRMMAMHSLWGEANHPMQQSLDRQLYIDMKNVSHSINSMEQKGHDFYGIIQSAPTVEGKALKGFIDQGTIASFSMRGLHKIERNPEGHYVVKQLRVLTYDWVPAPSNPRAHMCPANESSKLISKEAVLTVLASESVGALSEFEDLLQSDIKTAKKTESGIVLQGNDPSKLIGINASRALTRSILNSIF